MPQGASIARKRALCLRLRLPLLWRGFVRPLGLASDKMTPSGIFFQSKSAKQKPDAPRNKNMIQKNMILQ